MNKITKANTYREVWSQNSGVQRHCVEVMLDESMKDGDILAIASLKPSYNLHSLSIVSEGNVKAISLGCVGHERKECSSDPKQSNLSGILEKQELKEGCLDCNCKNLNCFGGASCAPDCCENICDPCVDGGNDDAAVVYTPESYDMVLTIHGDIESAGVLTLCFDYTMQ